MSLMSKYGLGILLKDAYTLFTMRFEPKNLLTGRQKLVCSYPKRVHILDAPSTHIRSTN